LKQTHGWLCTSVVNDVYLNGKGPRAVNKLASPPPTNINFSKFKINTEYFGAPEHCLTFIYVIYATALPPPLPTHSLFKYL